MSYKSQPPPGEYAQDWLHRELQAIEKAQHLAEELFFVERHVEPERPRSGQTVFADGIDWNPGSGQGVYTYYAGAWHKLG